MTSHHDHKAGLPNVHVYVQMVELNNKVLLSLEVHNQYSNIMVQRDSDISTQTQYDKHA